MPANLFIPRIEVVFSPLWWNHHYGMEFSKNWWSDPILRTEREREQRRLLFERFGDCGLGEENPLPKPVIGVEYGDRFMAALWGCEIVYFIDQEPAAIALPDAKDRMHNLALPDIYTSPIVQKSLQDGRILEERYGSCLMSVNFGGPLNNAFSIFGEEILVCCLSDPKLAQHILFQMSKAILEIHENVVCKFNHVPAEETYLQFFGLGNCPVCMISPQLYERVVQPVDGWLRTQFSGEFMLHHDGLFHPYNEVYKPLSPTWLDVGWGTDLRKVREDFPDVKISALIEVGDLGQMSLEEIDRTIYEMILAAGPVELFSHITIYGIGPDIPDSTIRHLLTVPNRLSSLLR